MNAPSTQFSLISDLEARQEDLMLQLDELNKQVERTLREYQSGGNLSLVSADLGGVANAN